MSDDKHVKMRWLNEIKSLECKSTMHRATFNLGTHLVTYQNKIYLTKPENFLGETMKWSPFTFAEEWSNNWIPTR